MLNEENSAFSDLSDPNYHEMQNNIELDCSTFNILTTDLMNGNELMGPMMMNMMNEDTTLSMEDYKYMTENGYLQNYREVEVFPPSEPLEICNTDYAGPYHFEVLVDPNVMKNPWEYSPTLHKIYIDMKHKFPINFSVKNPIPDQRLFVRAMPMFEEDRYFQELVHRCICHRLPQDQTNQGVPEAVMQHIIRCDNFRAQYFGDTDAGKRLSVVIPLSNPQAGTDSVKEFFSFVCKNSCVTGMNRRPIQVIFTLEDEGGAVLGRRVLCVRICSCPKRDREKEENKLEKHPSHSGKKRKLDKKVVIVQAPEPSDTRLFPLNFHVVGEENYKHVLKTVKSLMAEEIVKVEAKNGNSAPFKKCRSDVVELLGEGSD